MDQYQVTTDDEDNIIEDPNQADDGSYIVRLVGKVVNISVESVKLIKSLPKLKLPVDD